MNGKVATLLGYPHYSKSGNLTKILIVKVETKGYSSQEVSVKEVTLDEIKSGKLEGEMSKFNLMDMPDLGIITNNFANGYFNIKK